MSFASLLNVDGNGRVVSSNEISNTSTATQQQAGENSINPSIVGDRFYVATAERRKNGLKWEAECGASKCGIYELRYYHGPGTKKLLAKSKPIRAVRQFCTLTPSGDNLFLQNENGFHRVEIGQDLSLCEQTSYKKEGEYYGSS